MTSYFLRRTIAYIIDLAIVLIISITIGVLLVFGLFSHLPTTTKQNIFVYSLPIIASIFNLIYELVLSKSNLKSSIGKYITKVNVLTTDDIRLKSEQIIYRSILKTISNFSILPNLICLIEPNQRTLYDLLTDTKVVVYDYTPKVKINFPKVNKRLMHSIAFVLVFIFFANQLEAYRNTVLQDAKYESMLWNVFLAMIPLISSIMFYYGTSIKSKLFYFINFILFIVWFFFFPNSIYLLTDFVHLGEGNIKIIWNDIPMLELYTIAGILQSIISIYLIEEGLRNFIRQRYIKLFTHGYIILATFGLFLGRFLRLNSWEVISQPTELFENTLNYFTNTDQLSFAVSFVFLYSLIMYLMYYFIKPLLHD